MKFYIDGREYEDYQLSNEQIVRLLNSEDITDMGYNFLVEKGSLAKPCVEKLV